MKNFQILFFLLLGNLTLHAQGYIYTPDDLNDLPKMVIPKSSSKTLDEIGLAPSKDLTAFCPTPFSQGENHTCVAMAISAAYAIQKAIQVGIKNQPDEIIRQFSLSPVFPYQQMKVSCRSGAEFGRFLGFMSKTGNVSFAQTRFLTNCNNVYRDFTPADLIKLNADSVTFGKEDKNKAIRIMYALTREQPVVVGLQLKANFNDKAVIYQPNKYSPPLSTNHAVVAVGFDRKKRMIKFLNSHGAAYGENGFFYMRFEDVETETLQAFTFRPLQSAGRSFAVPSGVQLKIPHYLLEGGEPDYPSVQYQGEFLYTFGGREWKPKKDLFQVIVPQEASSWRIGVINITPDDSVKLIYPRKTKPILNGSKGLDDDEVEPIPQGERSIPTSETALEVKEPTGTDYLCILMSRKPINKITRSIARELERRRQNNIVPLIQKVLGNQLIQTGIEYVPDQLGFRLTNPQGDVVLLLLEIKSTR